jgi:enterobacterial common antigen flippase
MLILVLVVSLVFAFCPFIIQTLYGRGFDQVTSVLRLLLIEVVIACAVWLLTQAFMALDKPGVVTLFQGIGLGVSFPCMYLLIPKYGLNGAAAALLISTSVRLVFVLASFPFILKVSPPSFFIQKEDISFLRALVYK